MWTGGRIILKYSHISYFSSNFFLVSPLRPLVMVGEDLTLSTRICSAGGRISVKTLTMVGATQSRSKCRRVCILKITLTSHRPRLRPMVDILSPGLPRRHQARLGTLPILGIPLPHRHRASPGIRSPILG
eukprot:UN25647